METPSILETLQPAYMVPSWWPVIASIYYYIFTVALATLLRSFTRAIFPRSSAIYLLDLITAFQVCATSLENASVRYYHGLTGYLIAIVFLALLASLTFKDFKGNPLANVTGYLHKEQSLKRTLLRIVFQLVGGLMSYRYAKTLWAFKMNDVHSSRLYKLCSNDLTVDPWLGFMIEFGGTIFETYISFCTLSKNPAMDLSIKVAIGTINLALAVEYTGYYINPINATAQTFGCGGSDPVIFVLIYWLAPILATSGAIYLRRLWTSNSKVTTENHQNGSSSNYKSKNE